MYNSIYPININYRKQNPYRQADDTKNASNNEVNKDPQNTFPNGTKVAIDYSKGQINISQVLADFRSTIIAINAPDDVKNEVNLYLSLVDIESKKDSPSKDIIVSNLKNASRISDDYISKSLNKKSNVVEGWIDALFLQKINLKANPDEINPDFLLEFPKKAKERIENEKIQEIKPKEIEPKEEVIIPQIVPDEVEVESSLELSPIKNSIQITDIDTKTPFSPVGEEDKKARELFSKAKQFPKTNVGDTDALNLLNEALGILQNSDEVNENIRAAIHFERGKIFDSYDYVDFALRDYWEATKALDLNLKAKAFYKSAQVYDEFREFTPALNNYLSAVAYSGEADNLNAQTHALVKIAGLFSKQFDLKNTQDYSSLAIETAKDTDDESLLALTYSQSAQNYQYLGEDTKALNGYKNALEVFHRSDESYEQMAYNYEQASSVMEKLGNFAKAKKLQLKANQYYQKAQLLLDQQEQAS